jgi:exonuclease III
VVGFHAPYAAGARENRYGKQDAYRQLVKYITENDGAPLIVAMDSNHVMSDPVDLTVLPEPKDDPWRDEFRFMRSQGHGLQDVHRVWVSADTTRSAEVPTKGPLVVTYRRKNAERGDRMDRIWASQHFEVADSEADYERAVQLGSDHAIVTADLNWTADKG